MPTSTQHQTAGTDRHHQTANRRLIPLARWQDFHPWPSAQALRHYRFQAANDPAYAAWRRVFRTAGRRVLVDEQEFFALLDQSAQA